MGKAASIIPSPRSVEDLIREGESEGREVRVSPTTACKPGATYYLDGTHLGNPYRTIICSVYNDYAVEVLGTWDDSITKEKALASTYLRVLAHNARIDVFGWSDFL